MSLIRVFSIILIAVMLCGCQATSFYRQAIAGQWQIFSEQKPIDELMTSATVDSQLKLQLHSLLEIRQFAATNLDLPVHEHYLRYADLKRPFVVWNVYAAPELSLEPKTWWFPIIGNASYRGYFSEKGAKEYASELKKEGLDVFVGGVETYSTLGWFRDPALNTFIDESEADLAEILFHELGHQKLFVANDTDFNEAFATAVSEEGLRRWFDHQRRPELFENFRHEQEQRSAFTQIVLDTTKKLEAVYDDPKLKPEEKRARKVELIAALRKEHESFKAQWGGKSPFDGWFKSPINNAKLSTVATYYELVPAFRAILKENGGDLPRFYAAVKEISRLPIDKREEKLRSHLPANTDKMAVLQRHAGASLQGTALASPK